MSADCRAIGISMHDSSDKQNTWEERKTYFVKFREEVDKRLLQNSDNFDKALLTYSSAGLALSLGFLKDFIPLRDAKAGVLLYISWALFTATVIITIASYLTSQKALWRSLGLAERYYLRYDEAAITDRNVWEQLTIAAAVIGGCLFFFALVCSAVFVAVNLEESQVAKSSNRVEIQSIVPPAPLSGDSSAASQIGRGAPVPAMQAVPQQPSVGAAAAASAGAGQGQAANASASAAKP